MIRFEGKIQTLNTDENYELAYAYPVSTARNNISLKASNYKQLLKNYKSNRNPFIIGSSKLDGTKTFSNGEKFFIGNELSKVNEETGAIEFTNTTNEINMRINGSSSKPKIRMYIVFDSANNEFPTNIEVGYENNMTSIQVTNCVASVEITLYLDVAWHNLHINILNWNTANRPARVEAIFFTPIIDINKTSLQSVERNLSGASSSTEASYGLISNSATLDMFDIDGRISSIIEDGLIDATFPVELNLLDTLTGKSNSVFRYTATDFSYNKDDFTFSITCDDKLEDLQNYDIGYIEIAKNTSLKTTLEKFLTNTPFGEKVDIDEDLSNIYSNQDYVYSGTLWDNINQLCIANAIKGYVNEEGTLIFRKMV